MRPFCGLAKVTADDVEETPRGMMWRVYSSKTKKDSQDSRPHGSRPVDEEADENSTTGIRHSASSQHSWEGLEQG
jgi:hypothetical protein